MAKTIIGLDIAYNSLKVCGLNKQGKQYQLVGMNVANTPADPWKAEELQQREEIAKILKDALANAKPGAINGKELMIALPELVVFSTTVAIPALSKKDLEQALPYEIAERLSINLDEYYIDYEISPSLCRPLVDIPTPQESKEKPETKAPEKPTSNEPEDTTVIGAVVFAAAAKKSLIESLIEFAELAGLHLAGVDIKAGAIARAVVPDEKKIRLILDLGASATGVNVVEGLSPRLVSSVPLGTKVEANNPENDLENFKKKSGPIFDELVHVTKFFENRICPTAKIEEILITGGGSNIQNVAGYVQQETGLPVIVGNPMQHISSPHYPVPKDIAASFADSFGLSMRELTK